MGRPDNLENALGPVEGALFRTKFPTPTPGEVVPYPRSGITLEELNNGWEAALEEAKLAVEQARKNRPPLSEPQR